MEEDGGSARMKEEGGMPVGTSTTIEAKRKGGPSRGREESEADFFHGPLLVVSAFMCCKGNHGKRKQRSKHDVSGARAAFFFFTRLESVPNRPIVLTTALLGRNLNESIGGKFFFGNGNTCIRESIP